MKPQNELKNSNEQKGFSLVEIMIAIGILGTVSLGVMKIGQMMNRTTKQMNQQLDSVQLASRISGTIRNKDACRLTFRNVAPTLNGAATNNNAGIRDHDGNIVIGIGSVFGDITVEAIIFSEFDTTVNEVVSVEDPDNPGTYNPRNKRSATVRAQLKKGVSQFDEINQKNTIGTLLMSRDFNLTYFLNGAGRIESCYTEDAQYVEAACRSMGGVIDDGLCRGLDIRDRDATPGPLTNRAAIFRGNVEITSQNSVSGQQSLFVGGNATITDVLTVNGHSYLGNAAADRVFVTGQICLNGTNLASCATSWMVSLTTCVEVNSNICPPNTFVGGVYQAGGPWRLRCCGAEVK